MNSDRDMVLRPLGLDDLHPQLLAGFVRAQTVEQAWRGPHGRWRLQPVRFEEHWDAATLQDIVATDLRHSLAAGGAAWVVEVGGQVVAFATLCRPPLGRHGQYVQLLQLHVSQPWRGRGLGRRLLLQAARQARGWGAARLYISGHSSLESYAFYSAMGCLPAEEVVPEIAQREPCDLQLEYRL
ncbi:GNAT family N-acetyltransferase [Chitiniphilus purpureus]|uniref:GNAT family N-acetyltransferase n=1 Tax=Chitiniphilus purpureus TaxID=2981137 RepID=A0ABY6DQF2_9NEIS|nr:GNAT family N-acetyltransferase [Chitiniphilus sp. CD1]UXY15716.1 GNAT family N-acetyltransferase [Chitiniphilus sp. CD1]